MPFDDEIQQLTRSIWDTILHLPIESGSPGAAAGERAMSASVCITGAWRGAVALSCDAELVMQAAAIMFGLAPADTTTADMQDAMGELVNMIGGNFKALLPESCQLSLPSVVDGGDYSVRMPGSRVLTRVPLRSGAYGLSVSLLQSEQKSEVKAA